MTMHPFSELAHWMEHPPLNGENNGPDLLLLKMQALFLNGVPEGSPCPDTPQATPSEKRFHQMVHCACHLHSCLIDLMDFTHLYAQNRHLHGVAICNLPHTRQTLLRLDWLHKELEEVFTHLQKETNPHMLKKTVDALASLGVDMLSNLSVVLGARSFLHHEGFFFPAQLIDGFQPLVRLLQDALADHMSSLPTEAGHG